MSDPEFLGTVPLTDPNFVLSLSDVVKGQKYYWRVDQTTSIGIVQGETIWSLQSVRLRIWTCLSMPQTLNCRQSGGLVQF